MPIEGSLELFSLPEILQMVSVQRKTGILTIQGDDDIVAVSFKDGQVVGADALNQTVEEGLSQVLASQGLVAPQDFAHIQEQQGAGGKRLLDLLVEKGLIDRGQLLDALRTQTYRLLLQLLRWDQGQFKFYGGDEVAYEEGFYAISVEELLIRSLDDLGGEGPDSQLPDLDLVYERVPGGGRVKVIGKDGEGPTEDPSSLWVAPDELALVEKLDGTRNAREVMAETGLDEYKVLFTLHRLLQAGVFRRQATTPRPVPSLELTPPGLSSPQPRAAGAAPALEREPWDAPLGPRPVAPRPVPSPSPVTLSSALEEEEPDQRPPAGVTRPRVATLPSLEPWARAAVALAALAILVAGIHRPWELLLPFPWQEEIQQRMERNQRVAVYQSIDRAARTHFLLEGHYPDELVELIHVGLLHPQSLQDPRRRSLAYTADDLSYELFPVERGVTMADLATREAITGDFLLDPDFLRLSEVAARPPLVLLD
jgi:hypothetical protein